MASRTPRPARDCEDEWPLPASPRSDRDVAVEGFGAHHRRNLQRRHLDHFSGRQVMAIRLRSLALAAAFATPLVSAPAQRVEKTADFTWSDQIASGRWVRVSDINGT